MGNSSTLTLPEITNFRNVIDKPIRGVDPERMVPTTTRTQCQRCSVALSQSKRHNCRGCGEVICDACSASFDVLPDNKPLQKKARVCIRCIEEKRVVACLNCSQELVAKNYSLHEREECPSRMINCSLCQTRMKAKEESKHQKETCSMRLVKCKEGCPELVPYSQQEQHLQHECSKRKPCPHGCDVVLVPSKVAAHQWVCVCRPTACPACNEKVAHNLLSYHSKNGCPERIVSCDLGCGIADLKARNVAVHQKSVCPRRLVPCLDGCGQTVPHHLMNQHLTASCAKRALCQFGCNEMIAPSLFQSHRSVCLCRPATCPDCKDSLAFNKLSEHKTNYCQERFVVCDLCQTSGIKAKDLVSHSTQTCLQRRVDCPEGCGVTVTFSALNDHLRNACNKRAPCRLGCNTLVTNSLFADHLKSCSYRPTACSACRVEVALAKMTTHLRQDCGERLVACSLGCPRTDLKAKDLESHMRLDCQNRLVGCFDRCGQTLPFCQMKGHLERDCVNRVECRNGCGELVGPSIMEEHRVFCSHRATKCPHCQSTVTLNKLTVHQQSHCSERVVACPQHCSVRDLKVKQLPRHMLTECDRRWISCSDGCSRQFMFCQLTAHLTTTCSKRELCSFGCGGLIARSLVSEHSSLCPSRRVSCPLCVSSVQFHLLEDHKRNTCEERLVSCSLGCNTKRLKAKEIASHQTSQCPNREVPCNEYCGEKVKACELETHRSQTCRSRVRCPNSCGSLLPPSLVEKHQKEQCARRKVSCPICRQLHPYESLAQHQKVCPERQISCSLCHQSLTASQETYHLTHSCKQRLVPCSEGCGRKVKFLELESHLLRDCPNTKTLCATCGEMVQNSHMTVHDREECCRLCPQRHKLRLTLRSNGYKCDKCRSDISKGYSMACLSDNFDLCPSCYPHSSVTCPFSCNTSSLTYRTLNDHLKTCPNLPQQCFYCQQACTKAQLRAHQLHCSRRPSKITVAEQTMTKFLRNTMLSRDRCSVVAFNESYKMFSLLGSENQAITALNRCVRECGGGTHLWDAIGQSVLQFVHTANRSVPWVLIVLTDGDDQGSRLSLTECASILSLFNQDSTNFTFIIGLGQRRQRRKLQQLCRATRSLYLAAEDSELLDLLLAMIAVQIVKGCRSSIAAIGADAAYARVRTAHQIGRRPVEFLLLVDISSSMRDK